MAINITLGLLTKAEAIALFPLASIPKAAQQTHQALEDYISTLPDSVTDMVRAAANVKTLNQRKAKQGKHKRDQEVQNVVRKALQVGVSEKDHSRFMDLPTDTQQQACHKAFLDWTSNARVSRCICIVCARRLGAGSGDEIRIRDILHKEKLHLKHPHLAHVLTEGQLLKVTALVEECKEPWGWCCTECNKALKANKLSKLALANQMWIREVPAELSNLTLPEQLLTAKHFTCCVVYKLYPKQGGVRDPDVLQSGMKGNVSSYELNVDNVVKMVEGDLLPQKPEVLALVIAIAFIGVGKLLAQWLKRTFQVCQHYMQHALLWLAVHNPHYKGLEVAEDWIDLLLEDNIPEALMAIVHQEDDPVVINGEAAGYNPGEEVADEPAAVMTEWMFGKDKDEYGLGQDEAHELLRSVMNKGAVTHWMGAIQVQLQTWTFRTKAQHSNGSRYGQRRHG